MSRLTTPDEIAGMKDPSSVQTPPEKIRSGQLPEMVGSTALNIFNGYLVESTDPNNETKTLYKKILTYREMQADPTISGALQGYENILSLVDWSVKPADREAAGMSEEEFDKAKATESRDFVASCFDDMGETAIDDIVSAALDFLPIGFQITVPQFKVRAGENDNPKLNSKHNDGKIGWKNWKPIRQESIDRWLVQDGDAFEDLTGVRQRLKVGGYETIPRNRMLLFRSTSKGGSMEGESILYGGVKTFYRLQQTLGVEQVSLSRNLEGIPVLSMSSRYLSDNATQDEQTVRDFMIRQVKSVKYNQQTALVVPSDCDDKGNRLINIELLTAGPNVRVDQCRTVATACEQLIAESILANFMKLGDGGGSYAMSSNLTDMFVLAMKKYLNNIASVINKEAIRTLLKANGMDPKYAPRLVHEGLDTDSIGVFVDALMKSIAAGAVVPTKGIQKSVLDKLNLPTDEADGAWDKLEVMQEKLMAQAEAEAQESNTSNKDEIEESGVELSPEKVEKRLDGLEVFEIDGVLYKQENNTLVELT
jgi:hypothetical protein